MKINLELYTVEPEKVDELTHLLTLNNIDALPYHAGLDKNTEI